MNLALYGRCIDPYEGNKLVVSGGKATINGQPATSYTFKQDYFWMMGDNRHGSADSRFWGFVPNDHVVGKPVMVWLSMDPDKKFPMNIRWNRLISFVTKDGTTRSYGLHFLILLAAGIGLNMLYKRGKLDFIKRKR
jgi:signal peptidase I